MYLPEISARYRALKASPGATIEISPESQAYARDMAIRIGGASAPSAAQPTTTLPSASRQRSAPQQQPHSTVSSPPPEPALPKPHPSGAALIIDYGPPSTIPTNSLRGIRAHARVSPFAAPAAVDVSADVDFLALAEAAIAGSPGVEVHGPVDQARFLTAMGIAERAAQLVKRAVDAERGGGGGGGERAAGGKEGREAKSALRELAERIESGWKRLVDRGPQGMGRLYQVMAIVPYAPPAEGQPRRRPVGFGGDVVA